MAEIIIGVHAYSKMLLHTIKYPHHSVNGVFLAEKKKTKEHGSVNIVDCVPLFHLALSLTPMLEVAMMQVDQYCKEHSLVIAGYYQANEHIKDSNPDFIARQIAEKICENYPDACLVMVDNRRLSLDCEDVAIDVYQFNDNKWRVKDKNSIHFEQGHATLTVTSSLLHSKTYRQLVDFDNHLDDISLDWSNAAIHQHIDRCI